MIHRENERSEHQKKRGAAYTLTVVLGSGPINQRAIVIEVPFRGGSDERFVSVEREQ